MPVATDPPHELQLVIDFVNTLDLEEGSEALGSPVALASWLTARGLADPGLALGSSELARAYTLREALRAVMLAHNGGPEATLAPLQQEAERSRLAVSFDDHCESVLAAQASGFDGALGRLLIPVAEAAGDGSWLRVKACADDGCRWAFYDASRNRAGRWCDMAVCGNRNKVRSFRARSSDHR